jgi:hypothetical protein
MSKSPAAIVKQQFGDKAKLVAALDPLTNEDLWIGRVNEKKGLSRVSNAKLLRLFGILSAVKEKFGTRFKLVDAICEIEKRTKDEGYKKRLSTYPVPRLYDTYRSAARRAGIAVETKPVKVPRPARAAGEAPKPKPAAAKAAKAAHAGKAPAKSTAKKSPAKARAKAGKSTSGKKSGR